MALSPHTLSSRHRSVSALHPKADVHLGSGEVFSSGFAYFPRRVCVCVCVCGIDICVFLIGVLISTP
jgi:hypothetical protein